MCPDPTSIVLYRYDDPNLESTPIAENILDGKTEIPSYAVFTVNIERKTVEINVAGETYPIGKRLIYIDKDESSIYKKKKKRSFIFQFINIEVNLL